MRRGRSHWGVGFLVAMLVLAACAAPMPLARDSASMSEAPAAAPMEPSAGGAVAQGGELADAGAALARKVIARAALELVAADTAGAVDAITEMVEELDGYVAATNLYKSGYDGAQALRGTLTLRVPAEHLDDALDRLGEIAVDVRSRSLDREDVTDQYSDVDAQICNLEATEAELREMLAEVRARPNATPEDIMAVYRTLTEVRGEIEQLRGRKNMLDNLIALSTVEVTLIPDSAALPVVEEGWRPGAVVREAARALVGSLQVLGNVVIWVAIVILPLLVLAAIPVVLLFLVLRWLFRRFGRRTERPPQPGPAA